MTNKTQPDSGRATGGIVEMLHARIAELEARVQELGAMARENRSRRIVELEAQLEAVGAGGVSGPLMGRASLAASAGSEPVAWRYVPSKVWGDKVFTDDPVRAEDARQAGCIVEPLYTHPSPPEGIVGGWISVTERLPEWAARDDTPCFINGKEVPPTLTSETVLVALKGGGIRTDKLTTIEGNSDGWWHTYGERVVAWQKTPAPPASEAKGA